MAIRLSRRSGVLPIVALIAAGLADGACCPPPHPAGEYESQRGADLSRARELYAEGRNEQGEALLRQLASSGDWHVRARAIGVIGDIRDAALLPVLHKSLKDDNVEVREAASRVLQWVGNASSIEPLHGAIKDPEGIIRSHAAEALARIGGATELPALKGALLDDTDPGVRAMTATALGGIKDPDAVSLLVDALHDRSATVRVRTAEALGETGDGSARSALETVAAGDPDVGVRSAAAAALRRLEGRQEP